MAEQTLSIKTNKGAHPKGAFLCSGFKPDGRGNVKSDIILADVETQESGTRTEWLGTPSHFIERTYNGLNNVWVAADELHVFSNLETQIWRAADYDYTSDLQELAVDVDNEVVYTGDRYVGRTVTTTLNGSVTSGDTTITVSDTTGFPSSGDAVIIDGSISAGETISYGGTSGSDLTNVTRGQYNTSDSDHNDSTEIVALDDDWQDFGEKKDNRPTISIEDWVFIGNGRYVAGYNTSDGGNWATNQLDLPPEYTIVDFSSILTGSGLMLMVAANRGNTGDVFVWDMEADEWNRVLHMETNISNTHKNYIVSQTGIYKTNGFETQFVTTLPANMPSVQRASLEVGDMKSKGHYLYLTIDDNTSKEQYWRNRPGFWLLDTNDYSWYYVPSSDHTYDTSKGAIYISSDYDVFVGRSGVVDTLDDSADSRGIYYQAIVNPKDAATRKLKEVVLDVIPELGRYYSDQDVDCEIVLRAYNGARPLIQYTQVKSDSASADILHLDDQFGKPEVGDRVEIYQTGTNTSDFSMAPRNITAVNYDATDGEYDVTLQDDLPNTPNNTSDEGGIIMPLKRIGKKTITSDMTTDKLRFKIPRDKRLKFKQLMLEVELRINNTGTNIPLVMSNIDIKADQLSDG